ncbi:MULTISPECIES: SpoIID/LytB domain-containing protein [Aphanothece]|uniref:SpoIID/LytB domain-containing protein n=1 Tax=Aphanothece TaxID=1121 RepID=UPI00398E44D1
MPFPFRIPPLLSVGVSLSALAAVLPSPVVQAQQGEADVRVLLAEGPVLSLAAVERTLVLRPEGPSAAGIELSPGSPLELRLVQGRLQARGREGTTALPAAASIWLDLKPAQTAADGGVFRLQERRYRGRLQLRLIDGRIQAINHIGVEHYLPSVVASEMPARWPQAALRAQAVAARTYALRQRKPAAAFDLTATVSSQVYKGVEAETDSTRQAVASTRGQVLMYGDQLANTVFHSSSGGRTENSGDLWSQQLPYLVSVPDYDQNSPVHQWEQPLAPDLLRKAFGEIGGVQRIDIVASTATGRVRQARVIGPAGTLVVTGPQLRSRLGLRSTQVRFEVLEPRPAAGLPPLTPPPVVPEPLVDSATGMPMASGQRGGTAPGASGRWTPRTGSRPTAQPLIVAIGRGYGHGVGMSQWGALALAERGEDHERILSHYFRGTQLRRYPTP